MPLLMYLRLHLLESVNHFVNEMRVTHDPCEILNLALGLCFTTTSDFRWAVKQNAISGDFALKTLKNDRDWVTYKCK